MTDDRPLLIEAWLTGQAHREAFEDMSATQINALPMSQYARLTGREFKITAEPVAEPAPASAPGQDPAGVLAAQHPEHSTEHPGVDFSQLSMSDYALLRDQLGVGTGRQEGRGVFDSVGSRSQAYTDAARAQAGRTGWVNANVTPAPALTGRQVRQGDMRDTRSVAERFGIPGNSNTF